MTKNIQDRVLASGKDQLEQFILHVDRAERELENALVDEGPLLLDPMQVAALYLELSILKEVAGGRYKKFLRKVLYKLL